MSINNKRVKLRLKELLIDRGIEQKQLAEMTGVSVRTISEMVNNKTLRYSKEALEKIATSLNIDDINDIITLQDDE